MSRLHKLAPALALLVLLSGCADTSTQPTPTPSPTPTVFGTWLRIGASVVQILDIVPGPDGTAHVWVTLTTCSTYLHADMVSPTHMTVWITGDVLAVRTPHELAGRYTRSTPQAAGSAIVAMKKHC